MSRKDLEEHVVHREQEHRDDVSTSDVEHRVHHPTGWWNWRVLFNLIIVGLAMGLYGYDNAFVAPLLSLPFFIAKYQPGTPAGSFTARNLDLIVTVPLVGAAVGTFLAAPAMKYLGRKKTFLLAYFCFCTPGSFLQLFAPNVAGLVCGRFWNYFGISILTTTAPLYLSELVPVHVRGRAVGFCVAGVAAVAVLATTVVWGTEKIQNRLQYMVPLAIQAALPVILGLFTLFASESPVWHIFNGRLDQGRALLMALRSNNIEVVQAEISICQVAISEDADRRANTRFWDILKYSDIRRTLTAGAFLSASQVGGQILIQTYSTVILVQSGVADPFKITVVITCLQFLGTVIGPTMLDLFGRRPLALYGLGVLFVLNVAAGSLAAAGLTTDSQRKGLAAVFIIFAFFNAMSFQSLVFLIPAEIPRASLREPTMSWSLFWSYVTAVITTFAIPQLTTADGANLGAKAAFIFAGCVLLTLVFTYFNLPETKGRSMAEIDEMYNAKVPMRTWKDYNCNSVAVAADKVQSEV